jgi:hypothetical protein
VIHTNIRELDVTKQQLQQQKVPFGQNINTSNILIESSSSKILIEPSGKQSQYHSFQGQGSKYDSKWQGEISVEEEDPSDEDNGEENIDDADKEEVCLQNFYTDLEK